MPEENPYAPPQAELTAPEQPGAPVLAGRWKRLFGEILDNLFLWSVMGLTFQIAYDNWLKFSDSQERGDWGTYIAVQAFGLAVFLILNGHLLMARGQTLGKLILGTRVVRRDGCPAALARLVGLRILPMTVAASIPNTPFVVGLFLLDGLLIFRKNRRCLHDIIADTIVVKAGPHGTE